MPCHRTHAIESGVFLTKDPLPRLNDEQYMEAQTRRIDQLERERDALADWKKQQLTVESAWNPQEVAELLGMQLGSDIRAEIKPKIKALLLERDALKHALRLCLELVTEKDIAEENVMPELLPVIQANNAKVKAAIAAATTAIRVVWRDEHGTEFVPTMIAVPMKGENK